MTELPKVKVLIVEDQTIDALNASRYVESFGMSVLGIAKTAEKIFSIFDKCLPDIILMDINLGGEETGIEIGEAIVGTYGIPIIFTTSYSDDNTIAGALAISPYGYLVKPYGSASLETAMRVAIERRRIEDDIRESNSRFSMASNVAKLGVLEVDEASNSIFINGVENLYTFPKAC
ncbi:response regulator [uncultured Alteromonas sp.]|uniref:response regulator n=1 Tax=uncultured Alteromonas sp. TaxID=179113 RepID=UPI0030DA05AF